MAERTDRPGPTDPATGHGHSPTQIRLHWHFDRHYWDAFEHPVRLWWRLTALESAAAIGLVFAGNAIFGS